MTECASNSERLSALADGELGKYEAWRLRRHVANCAECARELADSMRINQAVRSADVAGILPKMLLGRHVQAQSRRSAFLLPGLIGAVGAVAAGICLVAFAPGQPGNPKIAYAEVTRAMAQVKTAHWTEVVKMYNRDSGEKESEIRSDNYVRLDPPTSIHITHFYSRPDVTTDEADAYSRSVMTETGLTRYDSESGSVTKVKVKQDSPLRERILHQFSAEAIVASYRRAGPLSPSVITTDHVRLGRVRAIKFTVVSPSSSDGKERAECRIWADESTSRILREESTSIINGSGKTFFRIVREGFQYDQPLGDATFALGAPVGATMHFLEFGARATVSKTMQETIATLIARTYKAYEHGDWKAFSDGWDFNYAAALPHSPVAPGQQEAAVRKIVEAARGKFLVYDAKMNGTSNATYTKIFGYPDAKVPLSRSRLLCVGTTARILYKDNFDCGGPERFFIRADGPDAPKIVGWSIMFGSRREADHQKWLKNGRHW